MKKQLLIFIGLFFILSHNTNAASYNIDISGMSYIPALLNVYIGDTVVIDANGYHPLTQVDSATWYANGSTPISGGINNATSAQTIVINSLNNIYFVCVAHVNMGMQGIISVSASPTTTITCDSIQIDSLEFSSNQSNTITLNAMTTVLDCVQYPGFILFNNYGDTIAKEILNYYCIGYAPNYQKHQLQVINNPVLPFSGYLELHEGFFDSLVCTFNVSMDDTLVTHISENNDYDFKIYPNPGKRDLNINFPTSFSGKLLIHKSIGKLVCSQIINNTNNARVNLASSIALINNVFLLTIS